MARLRTLRLTTQQSAGDVVRLAARATTCPNQEKTPVRVDVP